jgi:hypothetical protein
MGLVSGPNAWKTGTQDFSQSPGQRFLPGINFVLFQIMASLFTLLYTCASIVQFIEQVSSQDYNWPYPFQTTIVSLPADEHLFS